MRDDGTRSAPRRGYHARVSYRDDVDALFARVQALQGEVNRMRAEQELRDEGRGARPESPLAASQPKTVGWLAPLVAKLPPAEQDLIADLVTLFTTRREYPALDAVSAEALDKLVTRLRASFKKAP
jgi:hypothetical protein